MKRRLASWAFARPRVLVVDGPSTTALRWRVEAELDRRGWRQAATPADTDLLLVLGEAGPELSAAVDVLWGQVPQPRARRHLDEKADVSQALRLARDDVVRAALTAEPAGEPGDVPELSMAGTAPDRDGLELDSLSVTLGPVLPGWPTGLLVRGRLQGDVLSDVEISWADDAVTSPETAVAPQPVALDVLGRFLQVAGWPTEARAARRARQAVLEGSAAGGQAARGLATRVRRSRALRWSVRGLGVVRADAHRPSDLHGDVWDRVRRWCAVAAGERVHGPDAGERLGAARLGALLDGAELAAVRLVVAGLGPEALGAPLPAGVGDD